MAKKWINLKKKMSRAARARVDARVRETLAAMPLAEIRKAVGMTQAKLSKALAMRQGSVSKVENAADMFVSTLRKFVDAMGGDLVIKASFPRGRAGGRRRDIVIDQFSVLGEQRRRKTG